MPSRFLLYLPFFLAWLVVVDRAGETSFNNRPNYAVGLAQANGEAFARQPYSMSPDERSALLVHVTAQETETTASLWAKSKAAMAQGNFAEARRLLRQAVQQDPKDGALWFHLGASCAELNELDEAIAAFERARVLAPGQADTYFNLGLVYWRKGNLNKAKESYRSGLTLRPTETSALQNYALLLMKTGEYKAAISPLQRLKKDPKLSTSSRAALIECYLKAGQQASAEKESAEIIQDKVTGPADQSRIAAIFLENGAPAPAEMLFRNSLSLDPNQANAEAALGEIYLVQKKVPEAADAFQKAVQLDPGAETYAFGLVRVLLALKRSSDVIAFLKSVEAKFGALPNYQYALGLAYYNEHHYAESVAILEKLLLAKPPREDKVEHVLGDSYLSMGKLDLAESAYRRAIEENPKEPDYYVAYATAIRREGSDNLDDAIIRLKGAQRMNPGDWRIQLELGLCYESKGQLADAASLIEQAVKAQPDLTAGHVALIRIYFRLGRKDDSEREKKIVAGLEKKQQQKLVREYGTDTLIDGSSQPNTGAPVH